MMPQMDGSIFGWTAGADLLPGDPLGRLLLRNRSPLQVAACAVALSVLCNAVALTVALETVPLGSLLPKDPTRPYALMISVFTYDFVVAPLIWAFYAWVSRAPLSLLNELTSRRLFIEPTPGFVRGGLFGAQGYIDSSYSHRRWFWSGLAIAIILGVLGILYPPFHNTPAIKLYSQLKMIVVVPVCFMLWMVLSRIVATIKVLDLLFRHSDLQLNPLHPDRCGGLGPLNDLDGED